MLDFLTFNDVFSTKQTHPPSPPASLPSLGSAGEAPFTVGGTGEPTDPKRLFLLFLQVFHRRPNAAAGGLLIRTFTCRSVNRCILNPVWEMGRHICV